MRLKVFCAGAVGAWIGLQIGSALGVSGEVQIAAAFWFAWLLCEWQLREGRPRAASHTPDTTKRAGGGD